jgi:catechol 2,3-dioxygenase-like lactoylglutathione lyase family enzyme
MTKARFAHTSLVAADWRALASFYQRVFGCEVVPPERHFAGPTLEAGTGVTGARLDGAHLRLPGHGPAGRGLHMSEGEPGADSAYRLISTACVVTQYFASMLDFSHRGRVAGSFR